MKEARIKEIIREVIEEVFNGNHNIYSPVNQGHFPYEDADQVVPPNEISTDNQYMVDMSTAENQDTYTWPQEEFELGMSIEQKRAPKFNMYDHAEVVIDNLKSDKVFYTKLSQLN